MGVCSSAPAVARDQPGPAPNKTARPSRPVADSASDGLGGSQYGGSRRSSRDRRVSKEEAK